MRLWPAIAVVLGVVFGAGPCVAFAAPAAPSPLLTVSDLPPGFAPVAADALRGDVPLIAGLTCGADDEIARITTTTKGWSDGRVVVVEFVGQADSAELAAALQGDIDDCVDQLQLFSVPGVPGTYGWTITTTSDGKPLYQLGTFLRRGPMVAALLEFSAQPVDRTLITDLTAVAAGRMPAGDSGGLVTASSRFLDDPSAFLGTVAAPLVGLLLGWPEFLDALAVRRHRRAWRPAKGQPPSSARPDQLTDVTKAATAMHARALRLFLLELAALVAAGFGVLVLVDHPVLGLVLIVVAGAFEAWPFLRRRKTTRIGGLPRMRVGASAVRAAALIIGIAGFLTLLLAASAPTRVSKVETVTGAPNLGILAGLPSLAILALAVAVYRVAVRMTLAHPPAGDDRGTPILYLRSFGDDKLRLQVVPYARRTFLERLSSRRKQSFEEIIAEDLQQRAPVAAVGEPGRRSTPIGFVRRHLPGGEGWKPQVLKWIVEAEVIVVVVGLGEGLRWEIESLARTGRWRRTIFVFPPVEPDDLGKRRHRLAELMIGNGFDGVGVADPGTPALLVTVDEHEVCHYWCAERINAWSYKAALDSALHSLQPVGVRR